MKRTYTPEELTPRLLASHLDLYRRAEASAQNTRSEISKARTRLYELENHLTVLESEIIEAAEYAEAYFLHTGKMD